MPNGDKDAPNKLPADFFGTPSKEADDATKTRPEGLVSRTVTALRKASPYIAAAGATVIDPLTAPVAAPIAYEIAKGAFVPGGAQEIKEHPIRTAIEAGAVGLPLPGGRVLGRIGSGVTKAAARDPNLARTVGFGVGLLGGEAMRGMGIESSAISPWVGGAAGTAGAEILSRVGARALAREEEEMAVRDAIQQAADQPLSPASEGLSRATVERMRYHGPSYDPLKEAAGSRALGRIGAGTPARQVGKRAAEEATTEEAARTGRLILPGQRINPPEVESAGSAAQATDEDLVKLARAGDESAKRDLIRRRKASLLLGEIPYEKMPLPRP